MKIFQQEISESHRNVVKGQQMAKILPSYAWFVLGENGADESLIFYQNGTFVITQNNEEKKGLWAIQLHSPNALHETGRQHKRFASFFPEQRSAGSEITSGRCLSVFDKIRMRE